MISRLHHRWKGLLLTMHYNSSLKQKLIVAYSFFILFPILFIGFTANYAARDYMISTEKQAIQQHVAQLMNTIEYFFEIYMNKSEIMFNNEPLQEELKNPKSGMFEVLHSHKHISELVNTVFNDIRYPYMNNSIYFGGNLQITFYTRNQTLTSDGRDILPFEPIADEPWVRSLYDSRQKFSWDGKVRGGDGNEYIALSRRLLDFDTSHDLGVMRILIPIKRIDNIIEQNIHNADYSLALMDGRGRAVTSFGSIFSGNETEEIVSSSQWREGSTETTIHNDKYIAGFLHSEMNGWRLYYFTPIDTITNKVRFISRIILLTIIVSVLLCIIIATVISSFVTKRINLLVEKTNVIGRGDFHTNIKIKGRDEIGQLDRNFNSMMLKINHLIEKEYKSQIVLNQTKLELLQEQINPHLYYNSLAMIGSLAKQRQQQDIWQASHHLMAFYKGILNKGKIVTALKHELEMVVSYIEIMKFVYCLDIDTICDVEDGILECASIKLILQPIVENAILHGIRPQKEGVLELRGVREGKDIMFTITDSGIGMTGELVERVSRGLHQEGKGYGLGNVSRRLQLFYGEPYGIRVESFPGIGTSVTVMIPAHNEAELHLLLKNKYLI